MAAEIFVPEAPLPEHRERIFRLLDLYNDEKSRFPDPIAPFALLLREPGDQTVIGGLWAVSYWQWLFVDQVFVPDSQRGQGIGTELIRRA